MNPSRSSSLSRVAPLSRRSVDEIWATLISAARQAPVDNAQMHAPLGFSARVAALGLSGRRTAPSLLEAFSLRALGLAGLTAALALIVHFSVPQSVAAAEEELFFTVEDPSTLLLGEAGGLYE